MAKSETPQSRIFLEQPGPQRRGKSMAFKLQEYLLVMGILAAAIAAAAFLGQ